LPTWGELLNELQQTAAPQGLSAFDVVRRKYLALLHENTERNVIVYATNWVSGTVPAQFVNINDEDQEAMMEVLHGLEGDSLDLILHSPGGSAEATEGLVRYLRAKFKDIRVIIPHAAMSAATMLACASNRIVMGEHSFIGPIDPIFVINGQGVPAQAILDQFKLAREQCQDPKNLGTWLPILGQYGPGLLVQCRNAIDLSKSLVSQWLKRYMFAGTPRASHRAAKVARYLSTHKNFKTHGRHLDKGVAKQIGLVVDDLETDQTFQDLVLTVYHACSHTFAATGTAKLVENHLGKAYIKRVGSPIARLAPPPPGQPPTFPPPPGPPQVP
jgi:ATP-dependent protease ClpP protease subunit